MTDEGDTVTPNYFVDNLSGDSEEPDITNQFDDYNKAIAYAQTLYYSQADDEHPTIGIWDQNFNIAAIIFAAQIFVPKE